MTVYEQTAIERKYQGDTYAEIRKLLGKMGFQISEISIKKWFQVDGRLYIDYLTYESKMNAVSEEAGKTMYKQMATWVPKAELALYKKAVKNGDIRLAWDILKNINDRAGNVVVRKAEVNLDDKRTDPIETYEQFEAELRRQGINPRTGFRVAKAKMESN